MAECCIVGCSNKATKRGELKFYTLPTAKSSRPNKVKRRRLWLEAIEKANGSTTGLKEDAQICSAHFVSGQMSLEVSDQDFVPSVFPKPREKTRRETLRPRSGAIAEAPKVTPKKKAERKRAKTPEEVPQFNNVVFPEVNYCEPLEDEELLEYEEEATQLSTNQVSTEPPTEVPPEYPQLKKPRLELKSIIVRSGLFRCEVCNGKFSSGSVLVKHKELHDQEWSDDESFPTLSEKVFEKSDFIDIPVPVEESSFKCNMCDRSFPTIHNLKRHKLLHVRDARKCKQCGTMFCKRHNHVVAQPQISTETNFEDYPTKDDKMDVCTDNQMPDPSSRDSDVDESLDLLLSSDSQTLDAIAAAQDQSVQDTKQKTAPAITFSPRKPGLLTAFKSFLDKHKVANIKTEQLEPSSSCAQNAESPQVTTSAVTPDTTVTSATITATTPTATTPVTATTTSDTTATQPVPKPSSKPVPLKTSSNALTPQAGKPVLFITKQSQPQPRQPPHIEQSTVCLSFSKPLPSNVLKEFMSFISKNECSKSSGPRLITFTSKPEEAAPKQGPPGNEISSIIKLEPAAIPIQAPQQTNEPTALPKEEKTTFFITTQPKSYHKILPAALKAPLFVPPLKAPLSSSSVISPVKPKPKPKAMKTRKTKPFSIELEAPWKHYVHGSRPPSPEPILAKTQRGPWDLPFPNYPKDFIQPHLPQTPALPPALQMFSPQFLTSAFLDVKRDYDYILRK